MRAIARDLGVSVGALYRHVADRDALLTELIIAAYKSLGDAAERGSESGSPLAKWRGCWKAVRTWANEHPHEFDLIYGTPVIGYRAPAETVSAASRLPRRILEIAVLSPSPPRAPTMRTKTLLESFSQVRDWYRGGDTTVQEELTDAQIWHCLRAWTECIGALGFALHGHYVGSLDDDAPYYETIVDAHARALGFIEHSGDVG